MTVDAPAVAVVLASTRPGRKGEGVARWVLDQASTRRDATFELVDLADAALPALDEPVPPAAGRYFRRLTVPDSAAGEVPLFPIRRAYQQ